MLGLVLVRVLKFVLVFGISIGTTSVMGIGLVYIGININLVSVLLSMFISVIVSV